MAVAISAIATAVGGLAAAAGAGTIVSAGLGAAAAGAVTGGVVAAVTGGDIGQGMLGGALTAGIGSAAGAYLGGAAGAEMAAADAAQLAAQGMDAAMIGDTLSASYGLDALSAASMGQAAAFGGSVADIAGAAGAATSSSFGQSLLNQVTDPKTGKLLSFAGNLMGAATQATAAKRAAQIQADAAAKAGQQQLAIYQQQRADQAPWMAAGETALGQLSAGTREGGKFNKPFTMADAQNMPAYKFALEQGQQALGRQAAMGGQNLSAQNLQGQMGLAEGLAAQYENQAFNQNLSQNNQQYNQLAGLANTGQVAVNQVGADAGAYGTAAANATNNAAAANASGVIGQANAVQGGINAVLGGAAQMQTLSSLFAH
jgi:hypothetical protein